MMPVCGAPRKSLSARRGGTTKHAKGAKQMEEQRIIFKEESNRTMGACPKIELDRESVVLGKGVDLGGRRNINKKKIAFQEKPRLGLTYKGQPLQQEYEPDFLCFDKIILEIKAVKHLTDEHRAQVINYLKATGKQLGLLVNFGHHPKIEFERFVNQPLSRASRLS